MRDIEKGISNEEVAIKYGVSKKYNIELRKKQVELCQSTGSYSKYKGGRPCTGLEILHNFFVSNEKGGQGMQDLVEEFQNLQGLDKIDRLKQSWILNFLRKETRYFLLLRFLCHIVPSCFY